MCSQLSAAAARLTCAPPLEWRPEVRAPCACLCACVRTLLVGRRDLGVVVARSVGYCVRVVDICVTTVSAVPCSGGRLPSRALSFLVALSTFLDLFACRSTRFVGVSDRPLVPRAVGLVGCTMRPLASSALRTLRMCSRRQRSLRVPADSSFGVPGARLVRRRSGCSRWLLGL